MGNICRVVYRPDREKTHEYYSIVIEEKEVTKANLLCAVCGPTLLSDNVAPVSIV